jgi:sugar lactone lactonase YvrE
MAFPLLPAEAYQPVAVWNVGAVLGEGPVWVERDRALWFTDIKGRKVHRFDPAAGTGRSWDSPEQIGFVLPAGSGGFVAGLQSGLHRFDEQDGSFSPLAAVETDQPDNRLNDGTVDAAGRLWFGTMNDAETGPTGSFYRYQAGEVIATGISGIPITNGPAVSPDGRILYVVDTLARTIRACDIASDGSLGSLRPFAEIARGEGNPDGPMVDSEGCVWIALYGGSEARRYSPGGELLRRVRFPVSNITKIAFGGEDLRTAFATTARHLLKAPQDQAGDLFAFRVEVPGLPSPLAAA